MPCYKPITGWRQDYPNENGRYPLVFSPPKTKSGNQADFEKLEVPCGRCIGCRLEYSRQWAMRCMHESSLHDQNSFITLTYDDKNLPGDGSLNKDHWQAFLKSLRYYLAKKNIKIRFFMCGEYGQDQEKLDEGIDAIGRPHFHALIFGYGFPDKKLFNVKNDVKIYTSDELSSIWGKGFVTVGDVTFESCAYVARYVVKKITGENAIDHYQRVNETTGEVHLLEPEFCRQSRRPGIAKKWFDKYKTDLDKGFLTVNGRKMQPPKYYDRLFQEQDDVTFDAIKENRRVAALANADDSTFDRLNTRERIKSRKLKLLKRELQ